MGSARFELFGLAHLGALTLIIGLAALASRLARQPRLEKPVRWAVAAALVGLLVAHFVDLSSHRPLTLRDVLPLHLCDFAILLALFALATKHRLSTELLFFWTTTGTLLASVTPALRSGFPSTRFVTYFGLHGGVIIAAVVLVVGLGRWPRKGAVIRAWLLTAAYAACVQLANLGMNANFLFLRRKPRAETLLDLFGPWPVYLFVVAGLALVLFAGVAGLARWTRARLDGEAPQGLAPRSYTPV